MDKINILHQMDHIFRDILNNENITLTPETVARDIDGWNSLTHVQLVAAIETHFSVTFSLKEMLAWENIGAIIDNIQAKLT